MKLDQHPVFKGLNATQIASFSQACDDLTVAAGGKLIEEGAEADTLYFAYAGTFRVSLQSKDGEREVMASEAPAVLGEIELLTGAKRAATVTATAEMKVLALGFDELNARLADGDPATLKVFYNIARVLARRLADMNTQLAAYERALPEARVRELQVFRTQLFSDWSV